jgi:hypothetical protein
MAMTFVETVTLSATSNSVSFNSIPQNAVDLLILISTRQQASINTGEIDSVQFRLNSVNASGLRLSGNGTGASTNTLSDTSVTKFWSPNKNTTANVFGNTSIYIANYTSSTTKTYSLESVIENNDTSSALEISAGQVATNSAVTSITFLPQTSASGTFSIGCTFSLYTIS